MNFASKEDCSSQKQGYPIELNCCKQYGIHVQKLTMKIFYIKCECWLSVFLQLQFLNTFSVIMAGRMQNLTTLLKKLHLNKTRNQASTNHTDMNYLECSNFTLKKLQIFLVKAKV